MKGKWKRFELDKSAFSDFPKDITFAGTYIMFVNDNIIYIGESKNILERLKTHIHMARYTCYWKTRWGYFTNMEIAYREEKVNCERKMNESRLIERLKPKYNIINRGFKKWR